jgi:hypothetical protein
MFADRSNIPYEDVRNKEYDEEPEKLNQTRHRFPTSQRRSRE